MTLLDKWRDLAQIENERARENWDAENPFDRTYHSKTRDGLRPLLGSGMTHKEAAAVIGVHPTSVGKILRQHGWQL